MESRDFVYLQEAYQEIYQLDEEVEIATEYFYEMGLNEYGVNVLIEELGVDEFVDWVYDIAESYTLTEARARGSRIEPVTKSGKSIGSLKGGAKSAAINRLRKEKAARREAEERASAERPSGLKAALRSQAEKTAKKEQPKAKKETPTQTKKGIAGAIEWAKKKAQTDIEQTRKGLKTLGDTWQSVSDTKAAQAARIGAKKGSHFLERHGKTLGGAAGRAAAQNPAVAATFRAGQRLRSAMQREDYEFEAWVEGLWEEGYDLSDYTWEGLYEAYSEISERTFYGKMPGRAIQTRSTPSGSYTAGRNEPDQRDSMGSSSHAAMRDRWKEQDRIEKEESERHKREQEKEKEYRSSFRPPSRGIKHDEASIRRRQTGMLRRPQRTPSYVANMKGRQLDKSDPKQKERFNRIRKALKNKENWGTKNEEFEAYGVILDYVLNEGYAHDLDSADAIIASMSEEWIVDILEGFVSPYEGKPSYNDKWGYSPAMRAFRKSEELQKTEPGSKRQKMQN